MKRKRTPRRLLPPGPTREQIKYSEEIRERDEFLTRLRCDIFGFWVHCREKRCRRARRCCGDALACWDRRWYAFTEEQRQWGRYWLKARIEGNSPREAADIADAEKARNEAERAKWRTAVREGGAGAATDSAPSAVAEKGNPRVRTVLSP